MKRVHKWLSLVLGIIFVISSITGLLLAYKDVWLLWQYPVLENNAPSPSLDQTASTLDDILNRHNNLESNISYISMHSENIKGFQVNFEKNSIKYIEHVDAYTAYPFLEREVHEDFVMQLFDLHAHLFYGKDGKNLLGIMAFGFVAIIITGIITWRPRKHTIIKKLKLPKVKKVLPIAYWLHRFLGVVTMPFILISLLTGIGVVYYKPLQNALIFILNEDTPSKPVTQVQCLSDDMKVGFFDQLSSVNDIYPSAKIVRIYPAKNNESPVRYRLKFPEEWHQNGRSYVYINPCNNQVVYQHDARQDQAGVRLSNLLYPIHSVHVGDPILKFLISLSSFAVLVLFVTGLFTWIRRIKK